MTRKEEIGRKAVGVGLRMRDSLIVEGVDRKYAELYASIAQSHFIKGAEWADENPDSSWGVRLKLEREEWLDKACDWLINHNDYIKVFGNGIATGFDMARCVEDFRKAMED